MQRYWNKNLDNTLRRGKEGYYIKTKFGIIGIWNDDDGLYVDLCGDRGMAMCLMCLSEEHDGLLASVYGDNTKGLPTYEHMFDDLEHAFENDIIIDDDDEGDFGSA